MRRIKKNCDVSLYPLSPLFCPQVEFSSLQPVQNENAFILQILIPWPHCLWEKLNLEKEFFRDHNINKLYFTTVRKIYKFYDLA